MNAPLAIPLPDHVTLESPFEGILFDCDGVLVDSEPIANGVLRQLLSEHGLELPLEEMSRHFMGRSIESCVEIASRMRGRALPADFAGELESRFERALRAQVEPIPGAHALIDALEHRYAVVSSGSPNKIRTSLDACGLLARFEGRIFSVEAVRASKPAPDVYLLAAQTLGVAPERCLVVEDSPVGVQAGVAAGMTVCGFCRDTEAASLTRAGATHLAEELADVALLLERTALRLAPTAAFEAPELADLRAEAMCESLTRLGRFDRERARARVLEGFDPTNTRWIVAAGLRIGFVTIECCAREHGQPELHLAQLHLRPSHQGRGIGAAVLRYLGATADVLGFSIRLAALRASDSNRFYQRHGFELERESEWDLYYVRPARPARRKARSQDDAAR